MPDLADWRERLRGAIRKTGRRQNAIAEEVGISATTLSKILTGRHADPGFGVVVRITHACGEQVGFIVGEQPFNLSGEQRANIRTAAEILMNMTGGRQK